MASIQAEIGSAKNEVAAGVSDQELLERFVAGRDEAAFAGLVERHGGTIWRLCRRMLQKEHDAEDAYQAVFSVLARRASSIRRGEAVGSWLYSVAYRIASKARKAAQRRRELDTQTAAFAREQPPWSEAALREMQRILDEEVDRLSEKLRAPFVVCCLEGMSRAEAARELRCSEETVKARLAQARKLLQARLTRRGITVSAVLTAVALSQSTAAAAAPPVLAMSAGGASLSSSALAMAESLVRGMAVSELKVAVAVFSAMAMTVTAAGVAAYHLVSTPQKAGAPQAAVVAKDPETFLAPPTPLMKRHDEQVLAVALSPDGKRLVTAGARHTLPGQFMIWDVENRKKVVRLRGMRGIRGVAYSPDGKTVACGAFGGAVHLRDAETGKDRAVLNGHQIGVNAVAYSADGSLLASAGLDKIVKLWDVNRLAEKKAFVGHTDMVFCVAYFRHGTAIVSGGKDRTARIWDVDSGKMKHKLACPEAVEAVAVSPDDKTVVTGSWDRTIRLWDAATGSEQAVLRNEEGLILALAFSHDGALLASTSYDGSARIWDVKTRRTIRRLKSHTAAAWSAAFAPDSRVLATGSTDATAKLWDVATGKEMATLMTAEQKPVHAMAYSPDGKLLAIAGNDRQVQVRDAASGDVRLVFGGHSDIVTCVAISPNGTTVASGSSDKTIKLWDLATGKERRTLTGHSGTVLALAFAKDGKLASAGADKLVKWWDLADRREPTTLKGHENGVRALAFAPDGATLAKGDDNAVRALAFAPDGATLASGGADRMIRIWARGSDAPVLILAGHTGSVRALAFAPDGVLASAGDDGTVKLWGPGEVKERTTLRGHGGPALALAFTAGGRTLVSGGADKYAMVWDPATGKQRSALAGHNGSVTAVAIHPQGHELITGSDDTMLLRWPTAKPQADTGNGGVGGGGPFAKPQADVERQASVERHVPLTRRPENLPQMTLAGANAGKWLRFEPAGMRITIPPGFSRAAGHVALCTGIALKGDFEVTVNYEIMKLPEPEDAGPESGLTLCVWRGQSDMCITGVTRRVVENDEQQFSAWATWLEPPAKPTNHEEKLTATKAKKGRLRLVRTGGELFYYASESPDADLRLLNQISIGEADLDDLRLLGFTGGPRASLDARFWDLHIRRGPFPGTAAAGSAGAAPAKGGSRVWLTAVAVLGCVFALLFGLTLFLRRTRSRAEEPASAPANGKTDAAAAFVAFSCSCGKSLKAKAGLAGKKLKCPSCGAPVLVRSQA